MARSPVSKCEDSLFGKAWKNIPLTFTQACVCERDFLQPRHLVYSFLPFTGAKNGEFPLRRFTTKHSEKSLPGLSTWQMRTLSFKAFILLLLFWWIVYQEDLAQGNVKNTEQASSFSQNERLHEFRGYLFNPYCIFENRREPDTEPCWTPYLYSRKAVVASYPAVIVSFGFSLQIYRCIVYFHRKKIWNTTTPAILKWKKC